MYRFGIGKSDNVQVNVVEFVEHIPLQVGACKAESVRLSMRIRSVSGLRTRTRIEASAAQARKVGACEAAVFQQKHEKQ